MSGKRGSDADYEDLLMTARKACVKEEPSVFLSVSHYNAVQEFLRAIEWAAVEKRRPIIDDLIALRPLYTNKVREEFYAHDYGSGLNPENWASLCTSVHSDCLKLREAIEAWTRKYNLHLDLTGMGLYEEIALKALDTFARIGMMSLSRAIELHPSVRPEATGHMFPFVFSPTYSRDENEGIQDLIRRMESRERNGETHVSPDYLTGETWNPVAWNPREKDETVFRAEMTARFKAYLDEYTHRVREASMPVDHSSKEADYHYKWFALFQVAGMTMAAIGREYSELADSPSKAQEERDKLRRVNKGIAAVSPFCLLDQRPTSPGGKPPKRKL